MKYLLLLIVLFCAGWADSALALRCGDRLVNTGDAISRAEQYCPTPFWVERWESAGPYQEDYYGYTYHTTDAYEAWYINFGPRRLLRRLLFRNGYLYAEETFGYGFNQKRRRKRCSGAELSNAGDTLGEVFARCGPPDHEYSYPRTVYPGRSNRRYGYHGAPAVTVYRYIWTYQTGARGLARELHFEQGRLVASQVQRR